MSNKIIIAKSGFNALKETNPDNLKFSSDYNTLKYYLAGNQNIAITDDGTDQYVTVEVAHNLGYIPFFIVYVNGFTLTPSDQYYNIVPHVSNTSVRQLDGDAWADATKLYLQMHYYNTPLVGYIEDCYDENTGSRIGYRLGNNGSVLNGAVRFTGVSIPQGATIINATLSKYVGAKGSGSGNIKFKTYGIDEDNTGDFSSNPMGRTRTTAVHTENTALPSAGSYMTNSIINLVQEIVNRGGWSSGNAMGFLLLDDSSPADVWFEDDIGTANDTYMTVVYQKASYTGKFYYKIFKNNLGL